MNFFLQLLRTLLEEGQISEGRDINEGNTKFSKVMIVNDTRIRKSIDGTEIQCFLEIDEARVLMKPGY